MNSAGWNVPQLCGSTTGTVTPQSIINNLTAEIRGSIILVIWDRPSVSLSKIYVYTYADGRQIDRDVVRGNSFILRNMDTGTQYQFKVVAFPTSGITETKLTKVIGSVAPENYNLGIKATLSGSNIKVTWMIPDALDEYDEFRIYKDRREIDDVSIRNSQTSYTYTGADAGSTYYFELNVDQ